MCNGVSDACVRISNAKGQVISEFQVGTNGEFTLNNATTGYFIVAFYRPNPNIKSQAHLYLGAAEIVLTLPI